MIIRLNGNSNRYKIEHLVRMFYPAKELLFSDTSVENGEDRITATIAPIAENIIVAATLKISDKKTNLEDVLPTTATEIECLNQLCKLLYKLMSNQTLTSPPWGILTGVRPVSRARLLIGSGVSWEEATKQLQEDYLISPQKVKLALLTARHQEKIIKQLNDDCCCVYISIPFCPSRCAYCSFVSESIENQQYLIDDYLNLIVKELKQKAHIIREKKLRVKSVYIGGGTPTVLATNNLEKLLKAVNQLFPEVAAVEFTLEAGRPDTITKEKLAVAKKYGVNRISVNPQTLNQQVLDAVGRKHTVEDFLSAYSLVESMGFNSVNTDLILGLPHENEDSFVSGLNKIIQLSPTNITVHTLTLKRASNLTKAAGGYNSSYNLEDVLIQSQHQLIDSGYYPYYLYRQKSTVQNLENVGYSKKGHSSLYNIAMMEDISTVFGVGAGATTKLVSGSNIHRVYNFKFAHEYINRFDEVLNRREPIEKYYEHS